MAVANRKATKRSLPYRLAGMATLGSLICLSALPASASAPATSLAQVTALVKAGVKATTLTSQTAAALGAASNDITYYPLGRSSSCNNVAQCTLGSASATKTVVLLGDSKANMWVPAVLPAVEKAGAKLVILWLGLCPVAKLDVYAPNFGDPANCNNFRSSMVQLINSINPTAVIISERTGAVRSGPGRNYSSNAEWASALSATITSISAPNRKIAIMEDTPTFNWYLPTCLSQKPRSIQKCSQTAPLKFQPRMIAGERSAAATTHSTFIPTNVYFCTTSCPATIGGMIPFVDETHVSATYATYLSGLIGDALAPVLS